MTALAGRLSASGHIGLTPLLAGARLAVEGDVATLRYPDESRRIGQMAERGGKPEVLAAALSEELGRAVTLRVDYDPPPPADPEPTATRPPGDYAQVPPPCDDPPDRPEKPDPAKVGPPPRRGPSGPSDFSDVADDPLVRAVIEQLDAEIVKVE